MACVITSRADVGSSRITTLGFVIIDKAITTLCLIPPLNSKGYLHRKSSAIPTFLITSLARSIASFLDIFVCRTSGSIKWSTTFITGFSEFIAA